MDNTSLQRLLCSLEEDTTRGEVSDEPRNIVVVDDSQLVLSHIQTTHALASRVFGDRIPALKQETNFVHRVTVQEGIEYFRRQLQIGAAPPPLILDLQLLDNERGTDVLEFFRRMRLLIPTVMFSAVNAQDLQLPVRVGLANSATNTPEIPLLFMHKTGCPERDIELPLRVLQVESWARKNIDAPYHSAIQLIKQSEQDVADAGLQFEGPAYELATRASSLTVDMKALVTGFLEEFRAEFGNREELHEENQRHEEAQRRINLYCLEAHDRIEPDKRNRTLTDEEREAMKERMSFFDLAQWTDIDIHYPLTIAPDQVGRSLFDVSDDDRSRNYTVPKNRKNDIGHFLAHVRSLFEGLPRIAESCYGENIPVGKVPIPEELRHLLPPGRKEEKVEGTIVQEMVEFIKPYREQWEAMRAQYLAMNSQLHLYETPSEYATIPYLLEAIESISDSMEGAAEAEALPMERLQINREVLDFVLHQIQLNEKHDTIPRESNVIKVAKIALVRGVLESDQDSATRMNSTIPRSKRPRVGKPEGPNARLEISFASHESSFNPRDLRNGAHSRYFYSREEGGCGGNGFPPIAEMLRGHSLNFSIGNNSDGVAEVMLSIPVHLPQEGLDSIPLMSV